MGNRVVDFSDRYQRIKVPRDDTCVTSSVIIATLLCHSTVPLCWGRHMCISLLQRIPKRNSNAHCFSRPQSQRVAHNCGHRLCPAERGLRCRVPREEPRKIPRTFQAPLLLASYSKCRVKEPFGRVRQSGSVDRYPSLIFSSFPPSSIPTGLPRQGLCPDG